MNQSSKKNQAATAGGTVTLSDSTLSANVTTAGSAVGTSTIGGLSEGAGIYNHAGTITITDSTLSQNTATGGSTSGTGSQGGVGNGGGIYTELGAVTITASTLSQNSATSGSATGFSSLRNAAFGGGIYSSSGTLSVIDSTLASSSVAGGTGDNGSGTNQGGAAYSSDDTSVSINFSTLSSNTAISGGRGLYVSASGSESVTIDNSILGQTNNSAPDLVVRGGSVIESGSNNLIRSTTETGFGIVSTADPLLGALQDNDGTLDVILSKNAGSEAVISVFSGDDGSQITTFNTPSTTGGILASHDANSDGHADIFVGVTVNTGKHIEIFSGLDHSLLQTIDLDATSGLFVA